MTALMDLYRKIVYDWKHRRIVLPDNLRYFDMSIKVYDLRNLQKNPGKYSVSLLFYLLYTKYYVVT